MQVTAARGKAAVLLRKKPRDVADKFQTTTMKYNTPALQRLLGLIFKNSGLNCSADDF